MSESTADTITMIFGILLIIIIIYWWKEHKINKEAKHKLAVEKRMQELKEKEK